MRVVAGTARGLRLEAPAGDQVRPTTDRVREATFNALNSLDAIDEARAAGIKEFIFVTSRGKGALEDYFDHNLVLEQELDRGHVVDAGVTENMLVRLLRADIAAAAADDDTER